MGVTNKYLKSELESCREILSLEMQYTNRCSHKVNMYDYLTGYDDGRGGDFQHEYISLDRAAEYLHQEKFYFIDVLKKSGVLGDKNVPQQKYMEDGFLGVIQSNFRSGEMNVTLNVPVVRDDCFDRLKKLFDECCDNLNDDYVFDFDLDDCDDNCCIEDNYVWSYEQFNQ